MKNEPGGARKTWWINQSIGAALALMSVAVVLLHPTLEAAALIGEAAALAYAAVPSQLLSGTRRKIFGDRLVRLMHSSGKRAIRAARSVEPGRKATVVLVAVAGLLPW